MSIREEIRARVAAGELFPLAQTIPSDKSVRRIVVAKSINDQLSGPWNNDATAAQWNQIQADLESFVYGAPVTISRNPRRAKTAFLARLEGEKGQIWELRERTHKPGLRLIGGFAEKDLFVLLHWSLRIDLNNYGSPEWHAFINNCKAEWKRLFLTWLPLAADDYNEYLTGPILVI